MFEGGYKSRVPITVPNRGYGVTIMPEPIYKYPKDHPCYGCVFVFQTSRPSCLTGDYPDTENCINTFYKKIQERQRIEHEKRLNQSISK